MESRLFREVHSRAAIEAEQRAEQVAADKRRQLVDDLYTCRSAVGFPNINGVVNENGIHIRDIHKKFAAGEPIAEKIRDTLLTRGRIPPAPVALLQNTFPASICYMNSVLQAFATLPGFIGIEQWADAGCLQTDGDEKSSEALIAFINLFEAMRNPMADGANQDDYVTKAAVFYTSIYELSRNKPRAERLLPLCQSDANDFRNLLVTLMNTEFMGPTLTIDGEIMLLPLAGNLELVPDAPDAPPVYRNINTIIEVSAPIISLDEANFPGGLNQFLNYDTEPKKFHRLPDTLILQQNIAGFREDETASSDALVVMTPRPIVPVFDMAAYHPDGWVPMNPGSTRYRLHAIVCHHGENTTGAHYTAICLRGEQWYHIDDLPPQATPLELPAILPTAEANLVDAKPYIFFYVREGTGPYILAEDGTFQMQAIIGGIIAPPLPNIPAGPLPPPPPPPPAPLAAAPQPPTVLTTAEFRAAGVSEERIARALAGQAQALAQKAKKYTRKRNQRKQNRVSRKKRQ